MAPLSPPVFFSRRPGNEPPSPVRERMLSSYGQDMRESNWSVLAGDPETSNPTDDAIVVQSTLQSVADRVSRQVEAFAEKLDALNPARSQSSAERYEKALSLAASYRIFAQESFNGIYHNNTRNKHGASTRSMRKSEYQSPLNTGKTHVGQTVSRDHGIRQWSTELHTWELFETIAEIRFVKPGADVEKSKRDQLERVGTIHPYSPEIQIWRRFLIENDLAREYQKILSWITRAADLSGEDIEGIVKELEIGADRGSGLWAHGWLHTKEAIKKQKRLTSFSQQTESSRTLMAGNPTTLLVTELDPDAVTRQRRTLEEHDQSFEEALWLACWHMLRRGKTWDEIREWCKERVEGWRAVSMHGAETPWHIEVGDLDSDIDMSMVTHLMTGSKEDSDGTVDLDRMQARSRSSWLWRRMCVAVSNSGGLSKWETAIYAILGGDIIPAEAVCESWDDHIFVHYNALLISQFEEFIQTHYPERIPSGVTSTFRPSGVLKLYDDPDTARSIMVTRLKSLPAIQKESRHPLKLLQGALLANNFYDFAYYHGDLIYRQGHKGVQESQLKSDIPNFEELESGHIDPYDPDGLRVLTHMVLLYQDLGMDLGDSDRGAVVENIIVAYIDLLRAIGKTMLIPLYASRLSPDIAIVTLARVFIDIVDPGERRQHIQLMRDLGIDVSAVVSAQLKLNLKAYRASQPKGASFRLLSILQNSSGIFAGSIRGEHNRTSENDDWEDKDLMDHVRQVKPGFIGHEITREEEVLIRSFEWYLLIDGQWLETIKAGTQIYCLFLSFGRLAAARQLSRRMPLSIISSSKTVLVLGKSMGAQAALDVDGEEDPVEQGKSTSLVRPQEGTGAPEDQSLSAREIREHIIRKQASVYGGLEQLTRALDSLEHWAQITAHLWRTGRAFQRDSRSMLEGAVERVEHAVQPLFQDWLLDGQDHNRFSATNTNARHRQEAVESSVHGLRRIREKFLPEVILAYHSVLHTAGIALNPNYLTKCMDLAPALAGYDAEDHTSDIADCFVNTKRMQELVEGLAASSRAMLRVQDDKGRRRSKKGQGGESLALWNVRP